MNNLEISLKNIRTDVDYESLNFFENHLTHELKRLTDKEFIDKYKNIDNWCDTYEKKCLLVSVLEYISGKEIEFKPDGLILDIYNYSDFIDKNINDSDIKEIYNNSIDCFRKNGILYDEFGGFADGTYYRHTIYKQ